MTQDRFSKTRGQLTGREVEIAVGNLSRWGGIGSEKLGKATEFAREVNDDPLVAAEDSDEEIQRYFTDRELRSHLKRPENAALRRFLAEDEANAAAASEDMPQLSTLGKIAEVANIPQTVMEMATAVGTDIVQGLPEDGFVRETEKMTRLQAGSMAAAGMAGYYADAATGLSADLSYASRVDRYIQEGNEPFSTHLEAMEFLGIDPSEATPTERARAGQIFVYSQLDEEGRKAWQVKRADTFAESEEGIEYMANLVRRWQEDMPEGEELTWGNFHAWALQQGIVSLPYLVVSGASAAAGGPAGLFASGMAIGYSDANLEQMMTEDPVYGPADPPFRGDVTGYEYRSLRDPDFQERRNFVLPFYGGIEMAVGAVGRFSRPILRPFRDIPQELMERAVINWAKVAGKNIGASGAEEFMNEFVQAMLVEYAVDAEFDWTTEGITAKLKEGLAGAVAGAGYAVVPSVRGARRLAKTQQEFLRSGTEWMHIEEIDRLMPTIKMRDNTPERMRNFLQEKLGMDQTFVYVDAQALSEAIDAGTLTLKDVGLQSRQLRDALDRGGKVPVKTVEFAMNVAGKDGAQVFLENAAMRPEGYTKTEMREYLQEEMEAIATEEALGQADAEALAARRQAIEGALYDNLREAGLPHSNARRNAQGMAAFITTQGVRYGRDISERFGLQVEGPVQREAEQPPIVMVPLVDGAQERLNEVAEEIGIEPTILDSGVAVFQEPVPQEDVTVEASAADQIAPDSVPAPQDQPIDLATRTLDQDSVDLIEEPPALTPAEGNRLKVNDVGVFLNDRHFERYGRKLFPEENAEDYGIVYEAMVAEVEKQTEHVKSGAGWYSRDTNLALYNTAKKYQSVATPEGRALWLTMAGIMSNGLDPVNAWAAVEPLYKAWDKTGVIYEERADAHRAVGDPVKMSTGKDKDGNPYDKPASWTMRGAAVSNGIRIFKALVEKHGSIEAAANWATGMHTAAEINQAMFDGGLKGGRFKTKKEVEDTETLHPGYLAFGPKLGAYFNTLFSLTEGAEEAVIDKWFARTYRRMTGRLFDGPLEEGTGIVSMPSPARNGIERTTINRLARDVSEALSLHIEDVQAILWFYEQRLYTELGVKSKSGTNSDGAKKILEGTGIDFTEPDVGGGDQEGDGATADGQEGAGGDDGTAAGQPKHLDQGPVERGPVTEEDLANLDEDFFNREGWAVLTADRPFSNSIRVKRNLERKEQLRRDLENEGIPYREVYGRYGEPEDENSFVIIADVETAMKLGKKYEQESVLTPDGLVYTTRPQPNTPRDGTFKRGEAARKQGFFSYTQDGDAFAVGLDFSQGPGNAVIPQESHYESEERPQLPVRKKDGRVELYHWSDAKLDVVDPDFAGTGPYRDAANLAGSPVAYFGINPREDAREQGTGYVKEDLLGPEKHVALVDPGSLYPWFEDPEGLRPTEGKYGTLTDGQSDVGFAAAIRDAGYLGFYLTEDGSGRARLGNVATVFEPVPVKPAGDASFDQSPISWGSVPRNTIVREETGEPELLYHGTDKSFEEFADGMIFLSNARHLAVEHAMRSGTGKPRVVQATAALDNPLEIGPIDGDPDIYWLQNTIAIEGEMESGQHDGVMIHNPDGDLLVIATRGDQLTQRDRAFDQDAWHGSPHVFEKFQITNIGSGEGAQAFGWGLYFAESRGIAEFYRNKLAKSNKGVHFTTEKGEDRRVTAKSDIPFRVPEILMAAGVKPKVNEEGGRSWMWNGEEAPITAINQALDFAFEAEALPDVSELQSMLEDQYNFLAGNIGGFPPQLVVENIKIEAERALEIIEAANVEWRADQAGRLYKVHIPGPDEVLNWDATYAEQPEKVKAALDEIWAEAGGFRHNDYMYRLEEVVENFYANIAADGFWFAATDLTDNLDRATKVADLLTDNENSISARAKSLANRMMKDFEENVENDPNATLDVEIILDLEKLRRDLTQLFTADGGDGSPLISNGGALRSIINRIDEFLQLHREMGDSEVGTKPPEFASGTVIYQTLADAMGNDRAASETLRKHGIPGHRFLDASSRGSRENQTYNYVIYDDATIEIREFFQNQEGAPQAPQANPAATAQSVKNMSTWFGESAVTTESGAPMMVYHATRARTDFDAFRPFSHFGTARAARQRLSVEEQFSSPAQYEMMPERYGERTLPLYLSIQRPLDLGREQDVDGDEGGWNTDYEMFSQVERALRDRGFEEQANNLDELLTEELFQFEVTDPNLIDPLPLSLSFPELLNHVRFELIGDADTAAEAEQALTEAYAIAGQIIQDAGFDGIRYENVIEDPGSTSWVITRPEQAKSPFNAGDFSGDPRILRQGDEGPRGRITLPGGQVEDVISTIQIFAAQDPTTFAHEAAHWYLEVFRVLAESDDAPQAMRDDLATIHEWMGKDDSDPYTTREQELWARSFENYLFEGQAPSTYLKGFFSSLRRWMLAFYKQALAVDTEMSPAVRDVMDRMLATDQEIEAARVDLSDAPLYDAIPPGMSEAEWTAYQRLSIEAEDEAQERLLKKAMAGIRARDKAARRRAEKEIRPQVEEEVAQRPVYRLVQAIDNGGARLNTAQLEALVGEGGLRDFQSRKFGIGRNLYGEDGIDPEILADMMGFDSAKQMVTAIKTAARMDYVVDLEVSRRVEDQVGAPLSPEELTEEAKAAVKNPKSTEKTAREVTMIRKEMGGRATRWQRQNAAAKAEARRRVDALPVDQVLKYNSFLRDSQKAARQAQRALARVARDASGTPQAGSEAHLREAAEAKKQQLLSDHMFRAARDLAQKFEKGQQRMRRYLTKKTTRENIGGEYVMAIDTLLEQFDLRKSVTNKELAERKTLRELIDELTAEERHSELGALNIDPIILRDTQKRHYREMTAGAFASLIDAADNLAHVGRQITKAQVEGEKRRLAEITGTLVTQLGKHLKDRDVPRESAERSSLRRMYRQSLQWVLKAGSVILDIDGQEADGYAYNTIKRPIDEAASRNQARREQVLEEIAQLYNAHYTTSELGKMKADKRHYDELGHSMSRLGLIAMALNVGNEGNFNRLTSTETKQGTYTPEAVQEVLVRELTENDWQFVQEVWNYINSFWSEIAEQEERLSGFRPPKVEAALQIEGAPDFVTGGYFPIKYDRDMSGVANAQKRSEDAMDGFGGKYGKAQTKHGHTEARFEEIDRPLELNLGIIEDHVVGVVYDLEMREPLLNAWKIITQQPFQETMVAKGRAEDLEALEIWLQDVAAGDRLTAYGWEVPLRYFRNTFTVSRLGFNLKTALIQPLGLSQSFVVVGKKAMAQGIKKYMSAPQAWKTYAVENSNEMAERIRTMERDMNQISGQLKSGTSAKGRFRQAVDVSVPWMFMLMQKSQFWTVDMPTFVAAYEQKLGEGKSERDAIAHAENMVRRSQGSGLMSEGAMIERGTIGRQIRRSELPKAFTVLASYFFAKANVTRTRFQQAQQRGGIQEWMSFTGDMFLLYAFEAMVMAAINMDWDEDKDDLPLNYAKGVAAETGATIISTIPVARDVGSVVAGFDGGAYDAYLQTFPDMVTVLEDVFTGDIDRSTLANIADVSSLAFMPSSQMKRVIYGTLEDNLSLRDDAGRMATDTLGITRPDY